MNIRRDWDDLAYRTKCNLWAAGKDPRVPADWRPNEGTGDRSPRIPRTPKPAPPPREGSKRLYYANPEAITIDLSPASLEIDTDVLVSTVLATWEENHLSPKRIRFTVRGKCILEVANPDFRIGRVMDFRSGQKHRVSSPGMTETSALGSTFSQ